MNLKILLNFLAIFSLKIRSINATLLSVIIIIKMVSSLDFALLRKVMIVKMLFLLLTYKKNILKCKLEICLLIILEVICMWITRED